MQLELKHLAPYLPYGLKMQYVVREKVEKTGIMKSIIHNEDETHPTKVSIECGDAEHIWMFKPILRPLSDLTKEIEVNGEKFVPYEKLNYKPTIKYVAEYPFSFIDLQHISYYSFDCLIEWHFDVFGLIENGLAIDINTLNN